LGSSNLGWNRTTTDQITHVERDRHAEARQSG
jgi:hypothetical protein